MFMTTRPMKWMIPCLLAAVMLGCHGGRPKAAEDWNVLLLTFDTTRADFIGCYGRKNAQTPNLDRLAAEGFLFESNFSSHPVTQPSHSTILTGVYPMVHGVRDNSMFKLPEQRTTLAEALRPAGWATGAAVGGFPLVREFGLSQGFDFYDDDITGNREDFRGRPAPRQGGTWYDERPAAQVNDAILPWLRERIGGRFFVWLHYWDPHLPHTAPPPYGQLYAHDPYQGEIAYADQSLGTILRELEKAGVYDRTLIVMTADHGEGRDEHNEATHAFLAYGSTLHVPLIMKVPGMQGGRRIRQRVGTVDIVPTVLDLLGVEGPKELQGRSLAPLLRAPENGNSPPLYYSESLSPRLSHGFGELRVLYDGTLKYIYGPRPELFDLEDDPRELHDLSAERPAEALRLEAALGSFVHQHASSEAAHAAHEVDEATRQRLEALGYLGTGGEKEQAVGETLRRDGIPPQDRVGDINLASRLRTQLGQGQFAAARKTAERLLANAPANVFYRAMLARALLGLKEPLEAARVVEESPNLGGAQQAVFLQVARGVFDAGERDRGRALAAKIAAAEDTAAARVTLASLAREAGEAEVFNAEIKRALELDKESAPARLEMARYLLDTGDLDGAERELKVLLEAQPLNLEGQLGWARLLRARGSDAEALQRVERVLRLAPRSCDARLEKLELLVALARREEAVKVQKDLGRDCRDEKWLAKAREIMGDA
jgi:arylsulfatase A-like enzyme/thioredoxin-like negative regulator of GroEL